MPAVALAILKVVGPAGAVLVALLAYNVLVDNPQVAREATLKERQALTARFMRDVEQAVTAERERQQGVMADAVRSYETALKAEAAARQKAEGQWERERSDYEQKLREAGRSFVVTDDDFEWLRRK